MEKYAVIVAGGSGQRMGAEVPKQFLLLRGKSLLCHSVNAFLNCYPDIHIILVLPAGHMEKGEEIIKELQPLHKVQITEGGATRFHSVQKGLQFVTEPSVVFVHDAVRCLVSKELIQRCHIQALEKGSAIPAVAATDSIRIVHGNTHTAANRNDVRVIQTPQTFVSTVLLPAFTTNYTDAFTDEATVVEFSGKDVFLIEGEYENIKITRPADLLVAEKILSERSSAFK